MASAACCGRSVPATIRTRPRGAGLRGSPSEGEGELIQRARTDRARLAKVEAAAREQAAELAAVAAQGQAERETLRTGGRRPPAGACAHRGPRPQGPPRSGDRAVEGGRARAARPGAGPRRPAGLARGACAPGSAAVPAVHRGAAPIGAARCAPDRRVRRAERAPPVAGSRGTNRPLRAPQHAASPWPKGLFHRALEPGRVRSVADGGCRLRRLDARVSATCSSSTTATTTGASTATTRPY